MVGERHNVAFMVGVIFGAAGAAVAALLSTPLSGAETRQQLSDRVASLRGGDGTSEPRGVQGGTTTVTTTRVYSSDTAAPTRVAVGATTTETTRIYSSDASKVVQAQGDDATVDTTRTFGS